MSMKERDTLFKRYIPAPIDAVKQAATDLISRKQIKVHSYSNVPIAEKFWQSGNLSNRAWQFSMHSFALLDALIAVGAWETIETLVCEWIVDYGQVDLAHLGEFPWHDHATALRLDRLSLIQLADKGVDFSDLARDHAELLLRDDFYSKHTNHGFDQALALLLASSAFESFHDTAKWQRVALERLIDELNFAFTDEGVHVENSPAYHVGMTANVVRARFLQKTLGIESDFDFDGLLNKALLFTSWITGPDRRLALLGDSTQKGGTPPAELAGLDNYRHAAWAATAGAEGAPVDSNVAVYPDAGYAIYRSDWHNWHNHVHLVMKSGFLSSYHRQDDDLNILLQGYGEHWLIDSGLYNHNQTDPVRIYMRSALAHNVPYVMGRRASRILPDEASRPTLVQIEAGTNGPIATWHATSKIYRNVSIARTVIIENADTFQLIDSIKHAGKATNTFIQFHVPADKRIQVSPTQARIIGREKQLTIRLAAGEVEGCKVYSGLNGKFKSALSLNHNMLKPSQVIVFGPIKTQRLRFRLEFV
jgi:hypothetical protein